MTVDAWPVARGLSLVLGLAFVTGCFLYLRLSRERVMGPAGLFLLVLVVWFGLRGILTALEPGYLALTAEQASPDQWPALLYALALTCVWAGVALTTYHSLPAKWVEERVRRVPLFRREWSPSVFRRVVLLYLLGLGGKAYRILTGTFVAIQQARPAAGGITVETGYNPLGILLGSVLPAVGTFSFVFLAVLCVRDRRWGVFALALAVEGSYAYLTAARGGLLITGAVTVLSLHYWGRLSTRSAVALGMTGLIAVFAIVVPYRDLLTSMGLGGSETVSIHTAAAHLQRAVETGLDGFLAAPAEFAERYILSRFAGLDMFAGSIRSVWSGEAPLAGGESFLSGMVSSLPRLVWPGRPQLNLGAWFPIQYLGAPRGTETAIPMPRIVEFYVNFGLVGVVLGGAMMGGILRGIRGLLRVRTAPALALFIYLATQFIVAGEKPFSRMFALWKPLALLLVCMWAISWGLASRSFGSKAETNAG